MSYIGSNQYERQRPSNSFYNSSSLNRSYIQTTVPHRNPRQQEIWELQSNHQNRLNYIHFKARLEGKELPEGDNQPDFKIPTFANELYSLQLEERELIETLRQEKRLLEEARLNTTTEIDKCKRMLEEFRAQRRRKLSEKQADNEARRKTYERELESLRQTIANEKTDIKVSIHQVEYAGDDDAFAKKMEHFAEVALEKVREYRLFSDMDYAKEQMESQLHNIPKVRKGFWEVYNLAMLCFLKRDFEEGKEYFNRFLQILKDSFYVGDLYIEWHEELYNHCIKQLCPALESQETAYKMVCDMIERRRNFFSSKPSYKKLKKEFTL